MVVLPKVPIHSCTFAFLRACCSALTQYYLNQTCMIIEKEFVRTPIANKIKQILTLSSKPFIVYPYRGRLSPSSLWRNWRVFWSRIVNKAEHSHVELPQRIEDVGPLCVTHANETCFRGGGWSTFVSLSVKRAALTKTYETSCSGLPERFPAEDSPISLGKG